MVCTYIGKKRRHHSYLIGEGGESKVQHLRVSILVLKLGFWILRARIYACNKSNALDMLPLMAPVSVTENSTTWLHRSRFCTHVFRPFEINSDGFNGVYLPNVLNPNSLRTRGSIACAYLTF